MNIAKAVAQASKDTSSKVGCYIVTKDNIPVSSGFNGMIAGADESKLSWERPKKYLVVIHAEQNAIIYARRDLTGCKAYVTQAPCETCLKLMLQANIREIVYDNCSIMRDRSSDDQKWAINALIVATGALIYNINGKSYQEELGYDNNN